MRENDAFSRRPGESWGRLCDGSTALHPSRWQALRGAHQVVAHNTQAVTKPWWCLPVQAKGADTQQQMFVLVWQAQLDASSSFILWGVPYRVADGALQCWWCGDGSRCLHADSSDAQQSRCVAVWQVVLTTLSSRSKMYHTWQACAEGGALVCCGVSREGVHTQHGCSFMWHVCVWWVCGNHWQPAERQETVFLG